MSWLKETRDRLCKLSGEDYAIIRECNTKIQFNFSLIGFFVLIILLCCLASALYFTDHLFHSWILDVGVGIIWGYIVTNMYILLLYTITPTLLPVKERKEQVIKTKNFQLTFSMGLRIFMVILLAIITAQPLNVLILTHNSVALANDIKFLLGHNPLATIITVAVIAIFLLPIYWKYSIRKLGKFYEKKAEIEKWIIEDNYKNFKQEYKQILESNISKYNKAVWESLMPYLNRLEKTHPVSYQQHYSDIKKELTNEKIDKYEYWGNHPYRTIHKSQTKSLLSEQDLLNHIYSETN